MSTLAEIEEALPMLTHDELLRLEAVLHRVQCGRAAAPAAECNPRMQALDALQARLALDAGKADAWLGVVRGARR